LTSNGQITIPKEVIKQINLKAGEKVVIKAEHNRRITSLGSRRNR